ncbi:MAG: OB-fold nucleic acid binding domain-containing protein, partial [Coriobacteriales bacterium]|nr:OB-fold nucleic acid binding domain-containing protein [Coriobacteriales bacterium]
MDRTRIAQLFADAQELGGATITVAGWLRSVRDMKQVAFVTVNDGSCFRDLQVVLNRAEFAAYDEVCALTLGTALIISGELVLTPEAKQPFELRAITVDVEGTSAPDYPLQKKRTSLEFLRTQQHLRPRTNLFRAVFRVR